MKIRLIALLLVLVMGSSFLAGCKNNAEEFEFEAPVDEKIEKEEEPEKEEQKPSNEEESESEEKEENEEPKKEEIKEEPEPEEEKPAAPEAGTLTNLFEVAHKSVGINVKGKDEKNSAYSVAEAIKVDEGDTLTFGPVSSAQVVMGYAYDSANKPLERISGSILKEEDSFEYGMKIYTYTVPKGATEVRMNVSSTVKDQFMLTKNYPSS